MTTATPRASAKAAGQPQYTTGRPCVHGHIAPRYTQSGACSACITAHVGRARAAYAAGPGAERKAQRDAYAQSVRVESVRLPLHCVTDTAAFVVALLVGRFPMLVDDGRVDLYAKPRIGANEGGTAIVRFLVHRDDMPTLRALADGECRRYSAALQARRRSA